MEINICPEWLLAKLGVPPRARVHVALLASALFALAGAPALIRVPHICLMRSLLGLPCPGCGVLHAMTAAIHGHLASALEANPGGLGLAFLLGFQVVARPVAMAWTRAGGLVTGVSRRGSQAVLGLLIVVWVARLICGGL
ncbi:MAG: DUF2752 domain-containing protein [Acidobacteriota bacterium]|jgi:hypothetical protein